MDTNISGKENKDYWGVEMWRAWYIHLQSVSCSVKLGRREQKRRLRGWQSRSKSISYAENKCFQGLTRPQLPLHAYSSYSSGTWALLCSGRLFLPLVPLHPSCQILALSQLPATPSRIITFWERKFLAIHSEINLTTSFLLCFVFSLVFSISNHLAYGCADFCKFCFYHWDKTLLSRDVSYLNYWCISSIFNNREYPPNICGMNAKELLKKLIGSSLNLRRSFGVWCMATLRTDILCYWTVVSAALWCGMFYCVFFFSEKDTSFHLFLKLFCI